jgi:hypothetical protein
MILTVTVLSVNIFSVIIYIIVDVKKGKGLRRFKVCEQFDGKLFV